MPKWTTDDIPDQTGRTAVVTGANSGIGLIAARELAAKGAKVVLACRDTGKGEQAARGMTGDVSVSKIDLGDLASVKAFADRFTAEHDGLDLLINNAGLMAPPRRETADGFESQLGTNHLGHFALTGHLLPTLRGRDDARVVTVSSSAHRMGKITFDDLQRERRYFRWTAYGQSKLANLLFALELDRRLQAAGTPIKALACHPGYAHTNLQHAAPPLLDRIFMEPLNRFVAQSPEMGALPTLYAATDPDVPGGLFIGPDGAGGMRGYPRPEKPSDAALDKDTARRLWEVSERLTGVTIAL